MEKTPRTDEAPTSLRVTFQVGDEETILTKRVVIGKGLCKRSQNGIELTGTVIGLFEIKNFARVAAAECNPPTNGATVQQVN